MKELNRKNRYHYTKNNCIIYSINHKLSNIIQQILPNIKEKNSTIVNIFQLLNNILILKRNIFLFIYTNKIDII